MTSIDISENVSIYRWPPNPNCPLCLQVGRGVAKFIPVMHEKDVVIWFCENWRKGCLYPLIEGSETVEKHTMPRRSVDPSLLGYIPLHEGDKPIRKHRDRVNILEEDKSPPGLDLVSSSSYTTTSRSPSIISHSTTSSEVSDQDLLLLAPKTTTTIAQTSVTTAIDPTAALFDDPISDLFDLDSAMPPAIRDPSPIVQRPMSVMQNSTPIFQNSTPTIRNSAPIFQNSAPMIRNSAPLIGNSAPIIQNSTSGVQFSKTVSQRPSPLIQRSSPGTQHLLIPRPAPILQNPTSLSQGSTSLLASNVGASSSAITPSRKRPLADLKKPEKQAFPGYASDSPSASNPASSAAKTSILEMVAKKMKKMKNL